MNTWNMTVVFDSKAKNPEATLTILNQTKILDDIDKMVLSSDLSDAKAIIEKVRR